MRRKRSDLSVSNFTDDNTSQMDNEQQMRFFQENQRIMNFMFAALQQLNESNHGKARKTLKQFLLQIQQSPNLTNKSYYVSLVLTTIAVSYFYQNQLAQCENYLNLSSEALDFEQNIHKEPYRHLYLKILCCLK